MKRPEEISNWDLDQKHIPAGYDMRSVPVASDGNFVKLMDKHNELVRLVIELADFAGLKFEGEE